MLREGNDARIVGQKVRARRSGPWHGVLAWRKHSRVHACWASPTFGSCLVHNGLARSNDQGGKINEGPK